MSKHPILYSILFIFLFLFLIFGIIYFLISSLGPNKNASLFQFGEIAIMEIEGPIFESKDFIKKIHQFKEDDSIKAVVMRLNSPGGAVAPSQEIFLEALKLKEKKTLVISMGTVAASGAYYIALAGHKIVAQGGTITGSIGVIMESFGFQNILDKAQIENRTLKSGTYKDAGSPFREMTEVEKQYLQALLDGMYNQFLLDVSNQRGIPLEDIEKIAEGKIFTGNDALRLDLIDQIGTLYDAIDEAKKLAGLSDKAKVIWPVKEKFPVEWMSHLSQIIHDLSLLLQGKAETTKAYYLMK